MGWVRLRRGACGWAATAPKAKRITVTTTTTTTTYEVPEDEDSEPEEEVRIFWRDDPAQNGERAYTWREEQVPRWLRISENLWRWRDLLSFAGSVLQLSQGRYARARIALGEQRPNAKQHARASGQGSGQRTSHRGA